MPTQSIVEHKAVGSSYQMLGSRNVDDEVSLNMYFEPISKQNELQSQGILRSVSGTELSFAFGGSEARGLYSTSYGYGSSPELIAVVDNRVFSKSGTGDPTRLTSTLPGTTGFVRFAETGGVQRSLLILDRALGSNALTSVRLSETDIVNRIPRHIDTPKNPYRLDSHNRMMPARPTCIASVANRIIVNDRGTGQIFISRPGVFGTGTIDVYQYSIYENGSTTPVEKNVPGCDLAEEMARFTNPISKIMYKEDGYTPDYYSADMETDTKWNWMSDTGAYQYETALATTGDVVVGMESINNSRLVVLGTKSYDIWELSSDESGNYSIERSTTGNNIGCSAPDSVAKTNNTVFWIGGGKDGANSVWALKDSTEPVRVSSPAIDRKLASMQVSDAVAFGYSYLGHSFVVFTFPTAGETLVFDTTTGFWHNRSSIDMTTGLDSSWSCLFATDFGGKTYFVTSGTPNLVVADKTKFTEWDGRNIRRMRRFAPLVSAYSPVILNEFRIECGVGLTDVLEPKTYIDGSNWHETEGYNPSVMMRCSPNGIVFGSAITARLGRAGHYDAECRWQQLGIGKYFVIELVVTDPVDFYIFDSKIRYIASGRF